MTKKEAAARVAYLIKGGERANAKALAEAHKLTTKDVPEMEAIQ